MKSERPKPLHRLCGKPMLWYVLDSFSEVDVAVAVIVVGHKAEWVTKRIGEEQVDVPLAFVEQSIQRGTGDAALMGVVGIPDDDDDGDVIVVAGDVPLLRSATIRALVDQHRSAGAAATVLTSQVDDPTGYGRVIRGADGRVKRIVEQTDATDEERTVTEINTSIYCFRRAVLAPALRRLEPDNAQGEYYLTDVIAVLSGAGYQIEAVEAGDPLETAGVNDRLQLAAAEAELRRRTNERLMSSGVTMFDPANTFIDTTVEVGRDVTLLPGTILQGSTRIGDGCEIGPNTRLVDCVVGSRSRIEEAAGRQATVGADAVVGPYAVLEPGTEVRDAVRTGPFYNSASGDG